MINVTYPLSLSKRSTKACCVGWTTPSLRIARLRLVDFLVKMWRLNGFWKVIRPVPVTLKRFFALEFVLTFGILITYVVTPCWRFCTGGTLFEPCGKNEKDRSFSGGKSKAKFLIRRGNIRKILAWKQKRGSYLIKKGKLTSLFQTIFQILPFSDFWAQTLPTFAFLPFSASLPGYLHLLTCPQTSIKATPLFLWTW